MSTPPPPSSHSVSRMARIASTSSRCNVSNAAPSSASMHGAVSSPKRGSAAHSLTSMPRTRLANAASSLPPHAASAARQRPRRKPHAASRASCRSATAATSFSAIAASIAVSTSTSASATVRATRAPSSAEMGAPHASQRAEPDALSNVQLLHAHSTTAAGAAARLGVRVSWWRTVPVTIPPRSPPPPPPPPAPASNPPLARRTTLGQPVEARREQVGPLTQRHAAASYAAAFPREQDGHRLLHVLQQELELVTGPREQPDCAVVLCSPVAAQLHRGLVTEVLQELAHDRLHLVRHVDLLHPLRSPLRPLLQCLLLRSHEGLEGHLRVFAFALALAFAILAFAFASAHGLRKPKLRRRNQGAPRWRGVCSRGGIHVTLCVILQGRIPTPHSTTTLRVGSTGSRHWAMST
eukprot:scaffold69557_cov59-Phaeocystis_antarctica.AAC.2